MGITIHYQGGIERAEDIPKLVDELEDIAESMGWQSQRINDDESEYWETENLETLKTKKNFLQSKIDQLGEAMEAEAALPEGVSVDELVARIEVMAKKLN